MSEIKVPPEINYWDWIVVDQQSCVVSKIYDKDSTMGVCEVVCNPDKPTNHDVDWDGEKWFFPERGYFGGYADKYPRLFAYVATLKRGKYV